MRELVIQGWIIGFNKVALTKLLRAKFGLSLLEAKSMTDQVLDNKQVKICLDGYANDEEEILHRLREIGVVAGSFPAYPSVTHYSGC